MFDLKVPASPLIVHISQPSIVVPRDLILHEVEYGIERWELVSPAGHLLLHVIWQDFNEEFHEVVSRHPMSILRSLPQPIADVDPESGDALALGERVKGSNAMKVNNLGAALVLPIELSPNLESIARFATGEGLASRVNTFTHHCA